MIERIQVTALDDGFRDDAAVETDDQHGGRARLFFWHQPHPLAGGIRKALIGIILRQGNSNEEVAIYRYVTEGSFDAYMWQALETKARFISQVMTGEAAIRRAEDIGGQELSYAEVKAIASGNPAVLTLAEADAELQWLAILKKNHADEQYLARRYRGELPETISQLTRRAADLEADQAIAAAHADDPIIIGDRPCARDQVLDRLNTVPDTVRETKCFLLGCFRGLEFGIVLHSGGAADVYLEGAATRHGLLSRDHQGPRAVLNALERLADSYGGPLATAHRDLEIAKAQLRDYEARLDQPFEQKDYQEELTALRDQLKAALSGGTPEASGQSQPTAAALAERIQALKSSHTIDATPERSRTRNASAAEAITARIRRRTARQPTVEPIPEAEIAAPTIELASIATHEEAPASAVTAIPEHSQPTPALPSGPELVAVTDQRPPERHPAQPLRPAYRERVRRGEKKASQLNLF
jgi:hypothetical protein